MNHSLVELLFLRVALNFAVRIKRQGNDRSAVQSDVRLLIANVLCLGYRCCGVSHLRSRNESFITFKLIREGWDLRDIHLILAHGLEEDFGLQTDYFHDFLCALVRFVLLGDLTRFLIL